eukprot:IDg15659t1
MRRIADKFMISRDDKFDENDDSALSINVEALEIDTSEFKKVIAPRIPEPESEPSADNDYEKDDSKSSQEDPQVPQITPEIFLC